jgi:4-aminobutyrate aminotransferase
MAPVARLDDVGAGLTLTLAPHPVACEAALASLEILIEERLPERAAELEPVLRHHLESLRAIVPGVARVSVIGLLSSIEIDVPHRSDPERLVLAVRHRMYENGVVARCSCSGGMLTVVFYPALVVDEHDLETGVAGVGEALVSVVGEM